MEKYKLYSPKVIKELLQNHGFRFSKSLGQNFLIDGNIIDKICDGAKITEKDNILEIGPGIGTLTQELCNRADKVVAIEIDKRLIPILEDTLSPYDNLDIINDDILNIDLIGLVKNRFHNSEVKVVANLPYYITTPIIIKLLEDRVKLDSIVVMVQKEVAQRMNASPGGKDYGALSVAVQYYCEPEIIVNVPKTVFMPMPNVDSAVIALKVHRSPRVSVDDEVLFFKIVKTAFGKRRKTLSNSLSTGGLGIEKKDIVRILEKLNIDPKRRAETLDIEDFAKITKEIYNQYY
ncbi:16S rRNA (adenine(1518)-N(6)/adenine(1519)-N(6))-dimethyltransferase RsmA [Clostridiisalibacter paucivorans]|uniref:16S rRNA (adenine(1518)-N(6)/adenine(1519)-N(6))- dimethyltransferase RsmA n=1 Tax=Clostridiisalibacter paucivorans TaxID=408753 RepID=UPI00054F1CDB|nr:16S rRNA (adenine(1518)-N(6)/adenine(1519)-N(6))-dimethyltransferase RsmA [Clostridiisalibacter paucivorans]